MTSLWIALLISTSAHALKKEPIALLQLKIECAEVSVTIEHTRASEQKPATTASEIAWISHVAHDRAFATNDGGDERRLTVWKTLVERLEKESKSSEVRGWMGPEGSKLADQVLKIYSDPRTHSWATGNPADKGPEKRLQEILTKKKGVTYAEHGGCDAKVD